eukprot:s2255_g2.t1
MALPVAVFALVASFVGEDAPVGRNLLNAARGFRTRAVLWVTAQNVLRSLGGTRRLTEPPCQVRCLVWDGTTVGVPHHRQPPPLVVPEPVLAGSGNAGFGAPKRGKVGRTDADLELGLTTWVIACRLPDGAGGLQPVLVIKLVVLDDLPRTIVVVSDEED